jgi:hypothetical protein
MAAEVLLNQDRATLTPAMIAAGRDLVRRLRERLPLVAAFWLYQEERGRWRLMLASPLVAERGSLETYRQVQAVLEGRPDRLSYGMNDLELDDITVIDPGNELVSLWRRVYPEGIRVGEARASGVSIAGRYFEGAFFYLLEPAPSPR